MYIFFIVNTWNMWLVINQYVLSDKHVYLLIRTGLKWFIPHCSVSLMMANGYASACLQKCLYTTTFSLPFYLIMVPGHLLLKWKNNLYKCSFFFFSFSVLSHKVTFLKTNI